jgi:hypothetical protein
MPELLQLRAIFLNCRNIRISGVSAPGYAIEMFVAAAYRGNLSGLDTISKSWSCIQCDIMF